MTPQDREALECILERNSHREILQVLDDIVRARKVRSFVAEGMSREEANEYLDELAAEKKARQR